MNADKIAVVDQGRVLEEGSHAELVAQDGIYAALVKKQTTKKDVLIGSGEKESPTLAAGRREMDGSAAASKKGPQTIDHLLDAVSADAAEVSAASSVSAPPTRDRYARRDHRSIPLVDFTTALGATVGSDHFWSCFGHHEVAALGLTCSATLAIFVANNRAARTGRSRSALARRTLSMGQ